jgi:cation transport ATPase
MRPWLLQLGAFIAVAVAMCVIFFDLHLAWFFAAAVVVLVCSLGGWALERSQRGRNS